MNINATYSSATEPDRDPLLGEEPLRHFPSRTSRNLVPTVEFTFADETPGEAVQIHRILLRDPLTGVIRMDADRPYPADATLAQGLAKLCSDTVLLITDRAVAVDSWLVRTFESGPCVAISGETVGRVRAVRVGGEVFRFEGEVDRIYLGGTSSRGGRTVDLLKD